MKIASHKTQHQFNYIYRIISSKKQKGKPRKTDSPFLENDITRFFIDMIRVFYSNYLYFWSQDHTIDGGSMNEAATMYIVTAS